MRYTVRVVGHPPLAVEVPSRIEFVPAPPNLASARRRIAERIAADVLPKLHDVAPSRELERDASGQVVRSFDYPATTRTQLAAFVGWEVAGRHLEGVE